MSKKVAIQVEELRKLEPLASLSDERLQELAPLVYVEQLAIGGSLFREGDFDNQTVYLLSGEVQLKSSDGSIFKTLSDKSDEIRFPLDDSQPRRTSCSALSRVKLLRIDNSVLDYMMMWDQMAISENEESLAQAEKAQDDRTQAQAGEAEKTAGIGEAPAEGAADATPAAGDAEPTGTGKAEAEESQAGQETVNTEEKVSEEKAPEEKAPEEKAPEEKAPEEKAPEEKAPEEKAPEEKAPEEKAPESTPARREERPPEAGEKAVSQAASPPADAASVDGEKAAEPATTPSEAISSAIPSTATDEQGGSSPRAAAPVPPVREKPAVTSHQATPVNGAPVPSRSPMTTEPTPVITPPEKKTRVESKPSQATGDRSWIRKMRHIMAFKSMPPANIKKLLECMESIEVKAGDTIIKQGEPGDYFYVLTEGEARVTRVIELATIEPGRSFGEEALISEDVRNASVTMNTDGVVMRLSKSDFNELLQEPMLQRLSPGEAKVMVAEGAVWLDVRHAREYHHSHLPHAINIPLHELRTRYDELDKSVMHVCYCSTGKRSSAAAFLLAQKGFKTAVLTGGVKVVAQDLQRNGN